MPKIPEDIIRSILDRADIVAVTSDFLKVAEDGREIYSAVPIPS